MKLYGKHTEESKKQIFGGIHLDGRTDNVQVICSVDFLRKKRYNTCHRFEFERNRIWTAGYIWTMPLLRGFCLKYLKK